MLTVWKEYLKIAWILIMYLLTSQRRLLCWKQDANKGKETVTNENKEATKEHIETMLTKKAKLLMQRKQLNADKDGKENRETELQEN